MNGKLRNYLSRLALVSDSMPSISTCESSQSVHCLFVFAVYTFSASTIIDIDMIFTTQDNIDHSARLMPKDDLGSEGNETQATVLDKLFAWVEKL